MYRTAFPSGWATDRPENNTVYLEAILPREALGPVPVVLVLHYWGAADFSVERRVAAKLNRHGIGAVLLTLPYHMRRSPRGVPSGTLAIQPSPAKLRENILQCVWDVRRTLDWIETRPEFKPSQVGILGTSLGAIVSAASSAVDTRIGPQCYLIGGVDLAHIIWRSSRVGPVRDSLRSQGYTEETLRHELESVEPEPLLAASPRRPALVFAAKYDTIVPPAATEKLIAALGNPVVKELGTGHFGGLLAASPILNSQADFFASCFFGTAFRPRPLRAPTLRFGTKLTPGRGLEVFGGPLLLGNPRGLHLNAHFTPRSAALVPTYQLNQSLGIELAIMARRRVLPGISWSFVL